MTAPINEVRIQGEVVMATSDAAGDLLAIKIPGESSPVPVLADDLEASEGDEVLVFGSVRYADLGGPAHQLVIRASAVHVLVARIQETP